MADRVELLKSLERLRWLEIAKKPRKPPRIEEAEIYCFFCGAAIEGSSGRVQILKGVREMACIRIPGGFVCNGMTPPTDEHECREFGYSLGRACKRCPVECYRNGMTAKEALADNKERIRRRRERNKQGRKCP